jgi:hypothetical protein
MNNEQFIGKSCGRSPSQLQVLRWHLPGGRRRQETSVRLAEIHTSLFLNKGVCDGAVGWGTALQAEWSRVQFPIVSLKFFIDNTSSCTMALELTQPPTEMSTRNISWGVKADAAEGWQPYHLHVPNVLKPGCLNLLEPSGPVQACNGIALYVNYYRLETQQY